MQDLDICLKEGISHKPSLPFESISEFLTHHAEKFGKKTAVTFMDVDQESHQTITYQDLLLKVQSLSYLFLTTYQLQPGDRIALHLSNTPLLLLCHLAAWANGLITVPLDLKRDSVERKLYKITTTNCKLIIGTGEKDEEILKDALESIPFLSENEIDDHSNKSIPFYKNLTDPALILFTSGTTAHPKGALLSVQNIFLNADGIIDWLKLTSSDKFYIILPLHHINSTTMSIATLLSGGTIVLSSRYTKKKFFTTMAEQSCTLSSIVPTICLDLLSEQEQFSKAKEGLKQVTRIQIGSAPVVQNDVEDFHKIYQIPLVQGYGSTETALRVSGVSPWGLANPIFQFLSNANSIGRELKWNNLTILLPNGTESKEDEEGEICVRGPVLTSGYLNDQEATRKAFFEGWFHTGDVGYWQLIDGAKQYFINGRAKEIIIKGGTNISPLSIEDALLKNFPQIKTCFVVGAPDRRFGEELAAVIVFHDTINEQDKKNIIERLSGKVTGKLSGLSDYETPQYCLVVSEEQLPKTSTGKVQRVIIRSYLQAMLNPLAQTSQTIFRQLTPFDQDFLDDAVTIHNTRWGDNLGINKEILTVALSEGVVIGAINKNNSKLSGILFALHADSNELISLKEKFQSYNQATGNQTLKTNNSLGDSLLLVSVATEGKAFLEEKIENLSQLKMQAESIIADYLPLDPVIKFHMNPKAGLSQGASILHIIPGGRESDIASLGYSVIMQYPQLTTPPILNNDASLGNQLLEASFIYAFTHHLHHIFAYSRPAGLLKYLKNMK